MLHNTEGGCIRINLSAVRQTPNGRQSARQNYLFNRLPVNLNNAIARVECREASERRWDGCTAVIISSCAPARTRGNGAEHPGPAQTIASCHNKWPSGGGKRKRILCCDLSWIPWPLSEGFRETRHISNWIGSPTSVPSSSIVRRLQGKLPRMQHK